MAEAVKGVIWRFQQGQERVLTANARCEVRFLCGVLRLAVCRCLMTASVMVQRQMENRPLSLRDNQYGPLLFELRLATRHLPGLARYGQLAAALDHDLAVQPF